MAGLEKKIAAAGAAVRGESDIAQWGLGDSLTVVVPDELVSEFVGILVKGEPSSLCDVLSANGITGSTSAPRGVGVPTMTVAPDGFSCVSTVKTIRQIAMCLP